MPRQLTYTDAAKLLGGDSEIVSRIDQIAGGALLAVAPAVPAALGLVDAKAEFVRLGHDLVRRLRERRTGLDRQTRTQRLHAAHTVLVVTAFFEVMAEQELPVRYRDLALSAAEQLALAEGATSGLPVPPSAAPALTSTVFAVAVPFPEAYESSEQFDQRLDGYYRDLAGAVLRFVCGLAAGQQLAERTEWQLDELRTQLVEAALTRYQELIRRLAGDFPEAGWWIEDRQHRATRAQVDAVGSAMAGLERHLCEIVTGQSPDARRRELASTYRAALTRSIVESGDTPPGIRIPTLDEAYVEPMFRVAMVGAGTRVSDHGWWDGVAVRDDLDSFLRRHLTQAGATVAPLLVLGQPGSGKSVLTRVLAARLPAEQFLPVRVILREVPATADLQDQIEYAIRDATGERLSWPQLARSANGALPVVLLDGFDELLQATGVNQTDYLIKVARFQRREADNGRPVAVIVTSRTSVADRAQAPAETVAMRLEPFDDQQVGAWLDRWNATNAAGLAAAGLRQLSAPSVLAHRELASQPLLLLMLALYDAADNALQHLDEDLGEGELYERLLRSFCVRELTKQQAGLTGRAMVSAIENELRRLSIVSFGMFNRGTQWITEADLQHDMEALLGPSRATEQRLPERHDLRGRLGEAEIVLGRFFFIHRAQATRGDDRLHTYEFLHATFGEYLVARFAWMVLRDTAARDRASTLRMTATGIDDDLLHALLSFAPLSVRAPITRFLAEMAARTAEAERDDLFELLLDLYHQVHDPRSGRSFDGYLPQRLGVPVRHAAYSANLVLLAVCVGGSLLAGQLYQQTTDSRRGYDPVDRWHEDALLWRSQLTGEEWSSMVDRLRLDRVWTGRGRDVMLSLDDGTFAVPPVDPNWTYRIEADAWVARLGVQIPYHHPDVVRRKSHFLCGNLDDVAHNALDPLTAALPSALNTLFSARQPEVASAANIVLAALFAPVTEPDPERRAEVYRRCTALMPVAFAKWPGTAASDLARVFLDRLATDPRVPPMVVAEALIRLEAALPYDWLATHRIVLPAIRACVTAHAGRDEHSDVRIMGAVRGMVIAARTDQVPGDLAEALVVAFERSKTPSGHPTQRPSANRADWPDLISLVQYLSGRVIETGEATQ